MNSDPTTSADLQSAKEECDGEGQRAWISLGGNVAWQGLIGGPLFERALAALEHDGFKLTAASRLWTGPAWPDPSDPPFFNAVAEGRWAGPPEDLLALLLRTEAAFGRVRGQKNAPRTLDLDLLDMEQSTGEFPGGLVLPHPRVGQRAFVLAPLADAAPDWRDRSTGFSAACLLEMIENKEEFVPVGVSKLKLRLNSAKP